MAVGGFDEDYLVGERDEDDRPKGAFGVHLANAEGDHFHVRNEVGSITEWVSSKGTRFWKGSKEGPLKT